LKSENAIDDDIKDYMPNFTDGRKAFEKHTDKKPYSWKDVAWVQGVAFSPPENMNEPEEHLNPSNMEPKTRPPGAGLRLKE
jgi:hypothetical protein